MGMRLLTLAEAQAWFDALPAGLRIASLSPAFAAADACRDERVECVFVGLESEGRRWWNGIHLQPLPGGPGVRGAISPYGYGGPLASSGDPAFIATAWSAYRAWCAGQGIVAEFCRFHPEAGNEAFFGGPVEETRATVSIDLSVAVLEDQFSPLARRRLHRAQRSGAAVRFSRAREDWQRFAAFHREAMRAMDAAPWYRFGDAYFRAMAQVPQAVLCICEIAGEWSSAGFYLFGPEVVEYHLGGNTPAGRETGTAYLMQAAAARRGQDQGARSLFLGGGITLSPQDPLLFHKKAFSRRLLPFRMSACIHDEAAYWQRAAAAGYDPEHPPGRLLMDA